MAAVSRPQVDDQGFTLVEHIVAITVIAGVLLGLLGVLGAGVKGVTVGRQRTLATSLGKGVIERFQGAYYDQTSFDSNMGMNLSDPGLPSDSRLTTDPLSGKRLLDGKALVGAANPVFTPYAWEITEASTTFRVNAYVTDSGVSSDRSRILTVYVAWAGATAQPASLRFTSAASPLDYATYPASDGSADVSGAQFTVSGNIGASGATEATEYLPAARSSTTDATLRRARGSATGAYTSVAVAGASSQDALADNDAATAAGAQASPALSIYSSSAVPTSDGALIVQPVSGTLQAASSAASDGSTTACNLSMGAADSDGWPWQQTCAGTNTASTAQLAGQVLGQGGALWTISSPWQTTTAIDHDVANNGSADAEARLDAPEVRVLALSSAASPGFQGAVKVGAFRATASAPSGPAAVAATPALSVPGGIAVTLWNGTGYQAPVNISGTTSSPLMASGTIVAGTDTISFTTRVQSQWDTPVSTVAGAVRTKATADFTSLLRITVDVEVISTSSPLTPRSFTLTADYGHVTARSTWTVTP